MTLSLLISTIDSRIESIPELLLEFNQSIKYIICYEYTDESFLKYIPKIIYNRQDINLITIKGKGLSRSRNVAIENCKSELALIVDDDARYTITQLLHIIKIFMMNPFVDIFSFQMSDMDGNPFRSYSPTRFSYKNRPRGTYYNSPEIAFRTNVHLPSFNEHFGLGAPVLSCGEEEVFLEDASKRGLNIQYFPYCIVRTRRGTTGGNFKNKSSVRKSKGAVLYIIHGFFGAVLRCLKYAIRYSEFKFIIRDAVDMIKGINYIRNVINEDINNHTNLQ